MKIYDKIENTRLLITIILCLCIIYIQSCFVINSTIEYKQEPVIKTDVKVHQKDTIKID